MPGCGDRLVPLRHAQGLSRGVARLCRVSAGSRARRYPRRLSPPPARSRSRRSTCRRRAPGAAYEGACSTLLPNPDTVAAFGEERMALGLARIEAHFFRHHLFAGERDLIARIRPIRQLPAIIVQGRYDMVCPIGSADELARAWPEAEYVIVARRRAFGDGAGHPRAAGGGDRAHEAPLKPAGVGRPVIRTREVRTAIRAPVTAQFTPGELCLELGCIGAEPEFFAEKPRRFDLRRRFVECDAGVTFALETGEAVDFKDRSKERGAGLAAVAGNCLGEFGCSSNYLWFARRSAAVRHRRRRLQCSAR